MNKKNLAMLLSAVMAVQNIAQPLTVFAEEETAGEEETKDSVSGSEPSSQADEEPSSPVNSGEEVEDDKDDSTVNTSDDVQPEESNIKESEEPNDSAVQDEIPGDNEEPSLSDIAVVNQTDENEEPSDNEKMDVESSEEESDSPEEPGIVTHTLQIQIYYPGETVPDTKTKTLPESEGAEEINITDVIPTGYSAFDSNSLTANEITTVNVTMDRDRSVAIFLRAKNVGYTVRYVFEGSKEDITIHQDGYTNEITEYDVKDSYPGYRWNYFNQISIKGDGSSELIVNWSKTTSLISFNSNGGTFIDPVEVDIESVTNLNNYKPTRAGYRFDYWTDEDGNKVETLTGLTNDITVFAVWEAEEVSYTLRYWTQSLEGDKTGWDFYSSSTATAKSESVISVSSISAPSGLTFNDGFILNEEKTNEQNAKDRTIQPNGSTVINVYYDRVPVTVTFNYSNGTVESFTGIYGEDFTDWPENTAWLYTNSTSKAMFLATYGIGQDFTKNSASKEWSLSLTQKTYSSGLNTTVYYLLEQPEDGSYSIVAEASTYVGTDNNKTIKLSLDNKYQGYEGYKYVRYDKNATQPSDSDLESASWWAGIKNSYDKNTSFTTAGNYYFAAQLSTYKIIYSDNYGKQIDGDSYKYAATLDAESILAQECEIPTSLPNYMHFSGWYLDAACTVRATTDNLKTMPSNNLVLYAGWVADIYTVNINYNCSEKENTRIKVNAGEVIPSYAIEVPERAGYTFTGWYLSDGVTRYSASKPVEEDGLTIEAHWKPITSATVTVRYLYNGQEIADSRDYPVTIGSPFSVKAPVIDNYRLKNVDERTITQTITGDCTIDFEYIPITTGYYAIQYVDADNGKVIDTESAVPSIDSTFVVSAENVPDQYDLVGAITKVGYAEDLINTDPVNPHYYSFTVRQRTVTIDVTQFRTVYDGSYHQISVDISVPTGYTFYLNENALSYQK